MRIGTRRVLRLAGGGEVVATYQSKVLLTQTANLLGYWKLNETSGTQVTDYSGHNYHYLYVGDPLPVLANAPDPFGETVCPRFVRANANYAVDVNPWRDAAHSAGFGAEGTAMIWCKLASADQWTDGNNEMQFTFGRNSTNYIEVKKDGAAVYGRTAFRRYTGGADWSQNSNAQSTLVNPWYHVAMTWSQTTGEAYGYVNGVQYGPGNAGTWSGDDFRESTIGCYMAGSNPWDGWLSHCATWNIALTAPEILALATV